MRYTFTTLFLMVSLFIGCSKSNPIPKERPTKSSYLNPQLLKKLDFKGQDIIAIKLKEQFYYVRKDGKKMPTLTYDGEADKFSDGLARTKSNGKIGFFNQNLDIILKPIYDFAFPFHNGVAEICVGCKEVIEDGIPILKGGDWKKIDRNGLVIE